MKATGKELFDPEQQRFTPSQDGELVLNYARSILRLHDELIAHLSEKQVSGGVILGVPDLYATSLLPPILSQFKQSFPGVQIELRCVLSAKLVEMVQDGQIDLALVTRMLDFSGGDVVHQEPLAWMTGADSTAYLEDPLPLALLPPGNILRDHAIESLESAGRRWRIACTSESISGLKAAAFGGMAVTVLGESARVKGLRILGKSENFDPIPPVDLLLYRAQRDAPLAVNTLYQYIKDSFSARSSMGGS